MEAEMGEKTYKDMQRLKQIVPKVAEDTKIRLDLMIKDFIANPDLKEITFSNQLTGMERAYLHFQATKHGLKSLSYGSGADRRLTLQRATEKVSLDTKSVSLTSESTNGIKLLASTFPASAQVPSCSPTGSSSGSRSASSVSSTASTSSRLATGIFPNVPRHRNTGYYLKYQSQLPIWQYKDQILKEIEENRVVFIQGSTGCGKTTQVPQFLLDDAASNSKKVRIICTVPRRVAAVSVSERVAKERGEPLGNTVGYQIRLESCISPIETLLTYCTSGILLRSLSNSDYAVLNTTTHVIIDEIHERDRQTDFLLACLRDIQRFFPNLRLILMGADMNNEMFSTYFGEEQECPIIQVEGRLHPVQVYYLEDILEMIQYENSEMKTSNDRDKKADAYNRLIEKLSGTTLETPVKSCEQSEELTVRPDVDIIIQQFWQFGDDNAFAAFMDLLVDEVHLVNYQHSSEGVTMLMAASARGEVEYAQNLLSFGASLDIKSNPAGNCYSAIDWAADHHQHEVLKVLLEHRYTMKLMPAMTDDDKTVNPEKYQRMASYLKSIDEERVDLLLILRLIHQIHMNSSRNDAILVFLPGYDEIVSLKHLLLTDNQLGFQQGSFLIFILHSNIQTGDQRAAFERPPAGVRKIVLSTNIAESSITIDDIVYVIDSGKAKEKSFDSLTSVTQLRSVWISKASVNQRRGRAGRCRRGICYHLFSSARYESMSEFPIPEIVRISLQELCLHARGFMRDGMKIEQFFARIPEPPAPIAVKKSVELLKVMGALTENENVTKLGSHLLDFPLEPFLGKALIYAVVFRCLDPILTLVSIMSYRDPFQLPSDPMDKQKSHERKVYFAKDSFSDHMAYLKAFQDWEKSKMFTEGTEQKFCRDNYLSSSTFEMVYAIRSQLLGQLRASGFVRSKGRYLTELNTNSHNWPLVKGVLVATLYPNVCAINHSKKVLYNSFNSKLGFHPSTTLVKKRTDVPSLNVEFLMFDEMTQLGPKNFVRGCTCVSTVAVALFAGSYQVTNSLEDGSEPDPRGCEDGRSLLSPPLSRLKINQWITLQGDKDVIENLSFLRSQINKLVLKRLESPTGDFNVEESALQTICAVLAREDKAVGFTDVAGIEQWPKLVSGNFMSVPRAGFEKSNGSTINGKD